ncbi:polyketide synthase, partial [Dapis sp. BLCC M172]|uniref:polyketide synthase n=1 Tax=Dapis sp. BLCC M172 TaxID=2975281 RepID=UPI003CE84169
MTKLNFNQDSVSNNSEVVELAELGNGVVQITMKDEKTKNGFSQGIVEGLHKCFNAVAQNQNYKVVVFTGYGNYFSSGGTKEELIRFYNKEYTINEFNFFRVALDCEIPVIAAMQGHSIGVGLLLGLYADLVVLSKESIYTGNFMRYGFTPGMGATFLLPEKMGFALGQEMMYTAKNYRGDELVKRGVSYPVLPRAEVLNFAIEMANTIAEKPRLSLITFKNHLTSRIKKELSEFLDEELAMHEITFHQPEVKSRIERIFSEVTIMRGKSDNVNVNQEAVKQEVQKNKQSNQPFQLSIPSYGLLKNLTWIPLEDQVPGKNEVKVKIKAVPVNFREVLNVLGMFEEYNTKRYRSGIISVENLTFGVEGVGTVVAVGSEVSQWKVGDDVILVYPGNAFSSFTICLPYDLVAKPSNLNMVESSTIFISFITGYYGLHELAKIQPGERVLIHAASGGAGQAALQLAQFFGAEVYATTSPQKMDILREQGVKHIMNSRTTDFASEVMELTQGQGVDIIFNSLTHGEYIPKNIDILAKGGRYIEIGRLNIWTDEQVYDRRPDIKYFPFDLSDQIGQNNNQLVSEMWASLKLLFESGNIKPLPYKGFSSEDVVEAFRCMQHRKHIGKIVVTMPEFDYREEGEEVNSYQQNNQD